MAYTTIDKPTDYFNTVLYTGNGSDNHTITGVGFQPDMIWIKERSSTSSHYLTSVGLGIGTRLEPDGTSTEATEGISAVTSDGFTIGTSTNQVNQNTITHVAWNWLAGGSPSSNTDGSITSSVSASTTAGFSIVSWTGNATSGATIGHGLGVKPRMIITKRRDSTSQWQTYEAINGATKYMTLNQTDATSSSTTRWNDTEPTTSVFSVGNSTEVNASGGTYIAYCFADVKGYSKIGSYTGNGSNDGSFIWTGFKPAWVLIKNSSTGNISWTLYDNKRPGYNEDNAYLLPNSSDSELSDKDIDLLSNGFKPRTSNSALGTSGDTYIYMAFAESPFVTSTGIPTTAR